MAKTKEASMQLPNMLAFERKLEVSDGLMFAGNWEDIDYVKNCIEKYEKKKECDGKCKAQCVEEYKQRWLPVKVVPRKNRATQSAAGINDEEKSKPNPVSADNDDANLPYDKDTLKVNFTLRIIGDLGKPFGCNDPKFEQAIGTKVDEFKNTGLKELAHRYAQNIASGRFFWRNRVCAEDLLIKVRVNRSEEAGPFSGYEFPLDDFDAQRGHDKLETLSAAIFKGLSGTQDFVLLEVEAYVRLGGGQHVFPSQEMNMGEKKKVLFKLGKDNDHAALHSVKVGNAIRTIDDWYDENAAFPIAVEPYGSVTQRGKAYRKSKTDLYTLMMGWVNDKPIEDDQKLYVLANLIRGGVFGGKSE